MAHDKNGKPIHVGDKVLVVSQGNQHHVHGVITDDGQVFGDLAGISKAKFVTFASDLEVVEKGEGNAEKAEYGPGCIVWGDGQPDPPPPPV